MKESDSPSGAPPQLPMWEGPAIGSDPAERIPIEGAVGAVEAMLRQPRRVLFQLSQPDAGRLTASMLGVAVVCGLIYGLVVGSFSGHSQWWAAPIKISVGLIISALICLPSLYIFGCLSGSNARVRELLGLLAGLLMLMTVLLIGFAPVAWLFSQSTESVNGMATLHLMFWFVATAFSLRFLQAGYSQFQVRSKGGLKVWAIIFLLVMLQMTTALRPIVGTADTFLPQEKKFFLSHWTDSLERSAEANTPKR